MSAYSLLDLSQVPVPDIIETLDFEVIFKDLKQQLININAQHAQVLNLESEPLTQVLHTFAYRELLLRAQLNDVTRANMLASATGYDLDAIGARYNIKRLEKSTNVLSEGRENEQNTENSQLLIQESDTNFRRRIQMAFNGLNTAGSEGSYIFHGLSSDPQVLDIDVTSPAPCEIVMTILSSQIPSGIPSDALLVKVRHYFGLKPDGSSGFKNYQLNDSEQLQNIRPLGDKLTIQKVDVVEYQVEAVLGLLPGVGQDEILLEAKKSLSTYSDKRHKLGKKISVSGLYSSLHLDGVDTVRLISPVSDIQVAKNQVAYCTNQLISTEVIYD
ncbi:baseplate assembly protein [Pseudoalteromonas denitrificans]|uniref:Phage-related baseplate assembly protein n=1 Tax=Pseudoalteromonas denitrificans DSM 6059 TaxID=1123010 RepID=A0A1I1Q469_9GAMM|nr:baseplate J/gp47 family protein [Pseudoalteromonas denitrificans]SFD16924.1 Phage-related baseplate assembly protein [Pseudoalteromonas denitrificans DSM 6059]